MKKRETIWVLIGMFTLAGSVAQATPSLQLDILGGTYDQATETTVSNGDSFDLYAYLVADSDSVDWTDRDTWYISAALTPTVAEGDGGDYGSFVFNGTIVQATASGMEYGIPPENSLYPDLPSHEIYDTFYKEFDFTFTSNTAAVINVEDSPGADLDTTGTGMYYTSFTVDTSGLVDGYEIHFDLYNLYPRNDKLFITSAPFSHDAESRGSSPVPEPATMLLFGTGLVGLAGAVHRMKNKK